MEVNGSEKTLSVKRQLCERAPCLRESWTLYRVEKEMEIQADESQGHFVSSVGRHCQGACLPVGPLDYMKQDGNRMGSELERARLEAL